jgi:hypothetical protein
LRAVVIRLAHGGANVRDRHDAVGARHQFENPLSAALILHQEAARIELDASAAVAAACVAAVTVVIYSEMMSSK